MSGSILDFIEGPARYLLLSRRINTIALAMVQIILLNSLACSSQHEHSATNLRRTITAQDAKNYFAEMAKASSSPKDYRDLELADIMKTAKAQTTDEPIELGNFQFQNLRENLLGYDDQLENFISDYPTVGALSDEAGIGSLEDLSEADIQEGFAYLDLLFNKNALNEMGDEYQQNSSGNGKLLFSKLSLRAASASCFGSGASLGWSGYTFGACLAGGVETAGGACIPAGLTFFGSALTFRGSDCLPERGSEPACPLNDLRCVPVD